MSRASVVQLQPEDGAADTPPTITTVLAATVIEAGA
jgi:hypothetical protein